MFDFRHQGKKERKAKPVKEDPAEREKRAVWTCIRAAAGCGQAMRMRKLIQGEPAVTTNPVPQSAVPDMPVFTLFDLLGSYVLGQKKRIFKSE